MLSRTENKVMEILIKCCENKQAVLISPTDLKNMVSIKNLTDSQLEKIINDLHVDGYFDLVYSDRRGEPVYCITILEKGKGYFRNLKVMQRTLLFRLAITVILAIISFLIGLVLKAIF